MKKYQLIENLPNGTQSICRISAFINRFFFMEDDASCWKLDAHIDYMLLNFITKMDLFLAERETGTPYFFCQYFEEVGEKSEGICGKLCEAYEARNGKYGACKNNGYIYEQTDRCFTLKLLDSD